MILNFIDEQDGKEYEVETIKPSFEISCYLMENSDVFLQVEKDGDTKNIDLKKIAEVFRETCKACVVRWREKNGVWCDDYKQLPASVASAIVGEIARRSQSIAKVRASAEKN